MFPPTLTQVEAWELPNLSSDPLFGCKIWPTPSWSSEFTCWRRIVSLESCFHVSSFGQSSWAQETCSRFPMLLNLHWIYRRFFMMFFIAFLVAISWLFMSLLSRFHDVSWLCVRFWVQAAHTSAPPSALDGSSWSSLGANPKAHTFCLRFVQQWCTSHSNTPEKLIFWCLLEYSQSPKWPSDVCDLWHPWSIPKHHSTANNTIAYAKPEYCFLASAFCLVLYTVKMRAMFFLTTCTNKKNISDVLHMKIIRTPAKYGCIIGNTMHLDFGKFWCCSSRHLRTVHETTQFLQWNQFNSLRHLLTMIN